jgi:EAL domain-containing protein (putative c-di-GMP-specific phosphodiesterase class I)
LKPIRSWRGKPPAGLAPPGDSAARSPRADTNERFVAFTFASADMVVEADSDGIVTYGAGTFSSRFGRPSETFIGMSVRALVAPADHDMLEGSLSLLRERGRLSPMLIRLDDPDHTPFALAGIVLPTASGARRLCLTFARPPAPLTDIRNAGTPRSFARASEARVRAGAPCDLGLIEICGDVGAVMSSSEVIGQALGAVVPDAMASEIAPGRFGLLGQANIARELPLVVAALESMLNARGVAVSVNARHLPVAADGLTPAQTVRVLRQALTVFAREGAAGLVKAGFDGGLAGYVRRAGARAATLREMIRGGNFSLVFQPIVSLADRATHHYEALIRPGPMPDFPVSSPQDFIMLAETLALAEELDIAVARLACAIAAQTKVRIAFNLSAQSLQSDGFRDRLVGVLTSNAACDAGLMLVEMTETAEIEAVDELIATAGALRSLGVPFCLDDFGAGVADIRMMRTLLPEIVKLDGSYMAGLANGGRDRAFVAGMVELARAVGADVVAERIETETEAEALKNLGVGYGQGWLFGRPGRLPGPWLTLRGLPDEPRREI